MNKTSFQKTVLAFVRRQPFKPFVVELVSGDRIVVKQPEAVAVGGAAAAYLHPDGEIDFFDSSTVSQLADISDNESKSSRRRSSH